MSNPSAHPRAKRDTDSGHTSSNKDGSTAMTQEVVSEDHATKESIIGTDQRERSANVSWGSIFAGIVTFLALTVLLAIGSAAMGLGDASGTANGIWTVVSLAIALAAGGYVAGALAVRGGLLHGFLAWAGSLLAALILAGWLSSSLLGAVGSAASEVSSKVDASSAQDAATEAADAAADAQDQISEEDVEKAADSVSEGMWWTFAGALIGAGIASFAGMAGARSVISKDDDVVETRAKKA